MYAKHLSIIAVAALAAKLVASTALATADNAFADKKKHKYDHNVYEPQWMYGARI
jgi:hypothetical protein